MKRLAGFRFFVTGIKSGHFQPGYRNMVGERLGKEARIRRECLAMVVLALVWVCLAGCGRSAPKEETARAGFDRIKVGDSIDQVWDMVTKTGGEIGGLRTLANDGTLHASWVLRDGGVALGHFEMKEGKVVSKNWEQKTREDLRKELEKR